MRLLSVPLLLQLVPAMAFISSGAHTSAFVGRASSKLFEGLSGKVFQLEEREGVCFVFAFCPLYVAFVAVIAVLAVVADTSSITDHHVNLRCLTPPPPPSIHFPDKDVAMTELVLNADSSVSFGETDGPLPVESTGKWSLNDGKFEMELSRKFETGDEGSTQSDLENRIGRFYYEVPVAFRGDLTKVGGKLAVEGSMIVSSSDLGDMQVGYFSLLDTSTVAGE